MKTKVIYIILCLFGHALYAQSLSDYLKIAEENNENIKAYEYKYKSSIEKATEVSSLPKTNIDAGFFIQETETRVGSQKARLAVTQPLPWFGTLKAKKESALFNAYAESNKIDYLKRELILQVKKAYYELYELNRKQQILRESLEILDSYKELAVAGLANNKATLVEVLKIKIERNNVWNDYKEATRNLDTQKEVFNLLLDRPSNEHINIPDKLDYAKLRSDDESTISLNPRILQIDNVHNALLKQKEVVKKERLPEIKLGINYIPVSEIPNMSFHENGKDVIMPTIGFKVPVFTKKYDSKLKQLEFEQQASNAAKKDLENKLLMQFQETDAKKSNTLEALRIKYENLEQIKEVQKVLMTIYPTAEIEFDKVLEVSQLKLKNELEIVTLEKKYAIYNSILESLTTSY